VARGWFGSFASGSIENGNPPLPFPGPFDKPLRLFPSFFSSSRDLTTPTKTPVARNLGAICSRGWKFSPLLDDRLEASLFILFAFCGRPLRALLRCPGAKGSLPPVSFFRVVPRLGDNGLFLSLLPDQTVGPFPLVLFLGSSPMRDRHHLPLVYQSLPRGRSAF